MNAQRRYLSRSAHPVRIQERSDGALPLITGYAAVFYREGDPTTEYEMWPADQYGPRVVERMMPTAFAQAVREDDVRGLFNHNPALVLGRTTSGTLRLSIDSVGLRYEIDPPDTVTARDLIASLRRGDITGSSFGFIPRKTEIRESKTGGKTTEAVIERHDVALIDVGPVTFPAYAGASSGVRAADGDRDAIRREIGRTRFARDRDAIALTLALLDADDD